jgi:3-oxoacyl-[acyl-carrier protein] reductase
VELGLGNKVALVTGASKGIGRAIALELAGEGCHVAICARGEPALLKARDEIIAKGVECYARCADITDPVSVSSLIDGVAAAFGRLDILVNNAGGARAGTFATISEQDLVADYTLKVLGQIRCTRAALPLLEKSASGRVININALAGRVLVPSLFATTLNRASCLALSKALAWELASKAILVNSINIGSVLTPQWETIRDRIAPGMPVEEFARRQAAGAIPLGRFGRPDEVSGLVAFLASERASYISGASIDVGGGFGTHI